MLKKGASHQKTLWEAGVKEASCYLVIVAQTVSKHWTPWWSPDRQVTQSQHNIKEQNPRRCLHTNFPLTSHVQTFPPQHKQHFLRNALSSKHFNYTRCTHSRWLNVAAGSWNCCQHCHFLPYCAKIGKKENVVLGQWWWRTNPTSF